MIDQCLSDEDLAAYAEGNVLPDERPRMEAHLSECPKCREIAEFVIRMGEPKLLPFREPSKQ